MRNKIVACILLSFFLSAVDGQERKQVDVFITNKAPIPLKEYLISIPWSQILEKNPSINSKQLVVIAATSKKQLPYQLEYKGTEIPQHLLVQLSIAVGATEKIVIQQGIPTRVSSKTFCRYVPERKDDFAWENDRIAFRVYGKALEGTKENANGIDVWVKRTNQLILNERYKRGEYHIDHGDGMDYYHVGFSLGAGNIAPYFNDSIYYPTNYREWKVLDNGPLRSSFQLSYDPWEVNGEKITMTKTISLDAGMQLSRIEVSFSFSKTDSLPVAVGIIKRNDPGTILLEQANGLMAYWEPTHLQDGTTGVGCLFLSPVKEVKVNNLHILSISQIPQGQSFVYYAGAAWDKAKLITSASAWFTHLQGVKNLMKTPPEIKIR